MMQHIVAFTVSFLFVILRTAETSDSLFDSDSFLLPSDEDFLDDTTNLFPEDDGDSLISFDGNLAGARLDCASNGNTDDLFL